MRRKPGAPSVFPGANPSPDPTGKRTYVIGRYAECFVGGVLVANLFHWEVKPVFDYSNLTAHGDYWQINAFLDAGWTARVRGYLNLQADTYFKAYTANNIPPLLTFVGYSTLGTAGNAKALWQGTCFIKEGSLEVPMPLVEQEITLIGTGTPTIGLG